MNAPEFQPIEDFRTEIKRIVFNGGWGAEDLDQLRNRINYAFIDLARLVTPEWMHSVAMDLKKYDFISI